MAGNLDRALNNVATTDIGVSVQAYDAANVLDADITYELLDTNGDVGTGSGQLAIGNHDHSGTYEPADATILKDADIGSTVQAYDADIAKINVPRSWTATQTWTVTQRGTQTADNDGSFDMDVTNRFKCTPTGNFTLTFTNIASQGGMIILDNSGGHTVSAHANTKVSSTLLATLSTAGIYSVAYESDGTNVYVTGSQGLT